MNFLTIRKTKVIIMKKVISNFKIVNMEDEEVHAKNGAEELVFVNMVGYDVNPKIVEEVQFVNMVGYDVNATIVEEVQFVNMVDNDVHAKIVEEVLVVNMVGYDVNAKKKCGCGCGVKSFHFNFTKCGKRHGRIYKTELIIISRKLNLIKF